MKCVILAGGMSTRMPWKLMLTNRQGRNVVLAAADVFIQAGCNQRDLVFCVHEKAKFLISMIDHHFPHAGFALDDYTGLNVLNAIKEEMLVLCGDNHYGPMTLSHLQCGLTLGTTFATCNPEVKNPQGLDAYDIVNKRWVHREAVTAEPARYVPLTTPWHFKANDVIVDGLVRSLNVLRAVPRFCHDDEWRDLGTEESAKEYYEFPAST